MAGINIEPKADASRAAEPDISAKNIDVAIVIMLSPPLIKPTSAEAKAINLLEIPELFIMAPAKINKGIAINGKLFDPLYIARAVLTKYCGPVLTTIATIVATAMLIAIGIFIKSRNNKTENNNNTSI